MAKRVIKIARSGDVYLPEKTVRCLLDCRDGTAALVYLYLASHGGELDDKAAMHALGMTEDQLAHGLNLLSALGLTESAEPLPERGDEIPEYTGADVASALEGNTDFASLLKFTETRLGRRLSTPDTQTLLGIYDWMGLPADVICLLITACVEEHQKKNTGRRLTMRTIENRAKLWCSLGLTTQDAAGTYLKQQEERGEKVASLQHLLRITGRALSPTERKFLEQWAFLPEELVLKAYDITAVNTGKLNWQYMDKILQSWQAKGFRSVADVEAQSSTAQTETESVSHLRELNRTWGVEL